MDRLKRRIKRKLSAIICTRCGLAGHSDRDQRCPQWDVKDMQTFPPLSPECYLQLTNLLTEFKDQIGLTGDDVRWREGICRMIENSIRPLYPTAQLVLFGSSASGFGTVNSDLDISMKLTGAINHKRQAAVVRSLMKQLRRHACRDRWNQEDIKCIPWAKVPIVKMKLSHKWNRLECDISVGNYMALYNTEMLSTYARIDERVQTLGVALKQFAKSADMCDASSGSLSSYAYIILLLHYLQQVKPPVIPVLQQIGTPGTKIVEGCNCWFYQFDNVHQLSSVWPHVRRNQCSVGELWVSFFKYYTEEFNWRRRVVTVRQLEPLSKLEKSWMHKSCCIEDPFNHTRNLGGHLSDAMWAYIQEVLDNGRSHFCNPTFYETPITCERVFEGCGGIEDLPPKSIRRVNQSSSNINFAELPAVLGKRQHQATTIQQDNTVIVIDDDDEEVVEFVTKKPRVGNYGSTRSEGTQNPSPSIRNSAVSCKPVQVNSVAVSTPVSRHYEQGHQQPPRYRPTPPHPVPLLSLEPSYTNTPTLGPHSDSPKPLLSAPWSNPGNPAPRSTYTSPNYHAMRNDPILHSVTPPTHNHVLPERPPPWLNEPCPDRQYTMPETSSRMQDSSYNDLRFSPPSSVPYHKGSPHLTDYSRDDNRSSSSTSHRSGSGRDWQSSPGGSSATDSWQHSAHNGADNRFSDLFPLVYANSILSNYSQHQDKSHSDHYYSDNHHSLQHQDKSHNDNCYSDNHHSIPHQDKSHSDHYYSNNRHRRK